MSSYNKVILVGNLGDDPQTNVFENGQVTNFTMATSETWKDKNTGEKKELTEWSRIVLRNELSKLAEQYLKKGSKVLIEGKMRTRKWTDGNNIERYTTEIHGTNMTFLSTSQSNNSNESSAVDQYQANKNEAQDNGEPII